MSELPLWIPIGFFLVALCYSMVGFGGGSSYLALLVLSGLSYQEIPQIALVCNLVVTAGGCWHFHRAGHFRPRKVIPFVVFSIPMAYLGGSVTVSKELFCLLLGLALAVVALRMVWAAKEVARTKDVSWKQAWMIGLPFGALLGFLAGVVGIGGGIFLSPVLLLMRWCNVKEAAASASFFIICNSFSGLMGQMQKGAMHWEWVLLLAMIVFLGGQVGSRLGAYRVPKLRLQQALSALVLFASYKLLMGGL